MAGVPKHDIHEAAARPLRRGRAAAWLVFLGMAATTMAFQTYHSLHNGQMPWPLAYLYGIVPLGISIGVLIFAAVWPSKAGRAGAYLITAGAMYMSASATGTVTLHASSPHAELLFGFLLDGAALLAIRFIFDGPTAASAVAEVARREAELTAEAEAARAARNDADRALRELREQAEAQQAEAMRVHRTTVSVLEERANAARAEAETAAAKAEASARKLAAATGRGRAGNGTRKPAGNSARKPETLPAEAAPVNPDDLPGNWDALDTEARVLSLVDKGYSASKAGIAAGVTDARGRQIARLARDLSATAPQDVVGETKEG
jgi:hypothetical protein